MRRDGADPSRAVSYDRFATPRVLRSKRKAGDQRLKWNVEMIEQVEVALREAGLYYEQGVSDANRYSRIPALAQDRLAWKKWVRDWLERQRER